MSNYKSVTNKNQSISNNKQVKQIMLKVVFDH